MYLVGMIPTQQKANSFNYPAILHGEKGATETTGPCFQPANLFS